MRQDIVDINISNRRCRASVTVVGRGLRSCGKPATNLRIIPRRLTDNDLYFTCEDHTPVDDRPDDMIEQEASK